MNNKLSILTKGLFKENPTLVLTLGMCPSLELQLLLIMV
jgi:Na+-translocating ferredoxin:NAD+ oxidoreductase RnfE subunit